MLRNRFYILVCIIAVVPLGFVLKYYHGPANQWPNLYGAAVMYELFWCLCAYFVFPDRKHIVVIAFLVFTGTCILETMQIWHPPMLELIRSYRIGVWLIGNGFDWMDFPHYVLGSVLGWGIMRVVADSK
jgi:hypothetical protein